MCVSLGVPSSGNKRTLIERILARLDARERAAPPAAKKRSAVDAELAAPPASLRAAALDTASPPAASSSSSAGSPAAAASSVVQYFFWAARRRSYTRVELLAECERLIADSREHDATCGMCEECTARGLVRCHHRQGRGAELEDGSRLFISPGDTPASVAARLALPLDRTRTSDDRECSLTCEPFARPHWFSANGRSYSRDALVAAVGATLHRGDTLRLEDCVVEPMRVDSLRLVPNLSLPGWPAHAPPVISYTAADVRVRPFDLATETARNWTRFSTLLDVLKPDGNGTWDDAMSALVVQYAAHRGARVDELGEPPVFRDMLVRFAVVARCRPKMHVRFANMQFVDCVFVVRAWTPDMYGCEFRRCTLVVDPASSPSNDGRWQQCTFVDCLFVQLYSGERVWRTSRGQYGEWSGRGCAHLMSANAMISDGALQSVTAPALYRHVSVKSGHV